MLRNVIGVSVSRLRCSIARSPSSAVGAVSKKGLIVASRLGRLCVQCQGQYLLNIRQQDLVCYALIFALEHQKLEYFRVKLDDFLTSLRYLEYFFCLTYVYESRVAWSPTTSSSLPLSTMTPLEYAADDADDGEKA